MRPALRLATSNVFGRRSRTILLIAVVALSAALISAVATAMSSVEGALRKRLVSMVGSADARVTSVAQGDPFDARIADVVAGWEGVRAAIPRLQQPITLRAVRPVWGDAEPFKREIRVYATTAMGTSTSEGIDVKYKPIDLVEGNLPQAADEVVISEVLLARLRGQTGINGRRSSAMSQLTARLARMGRTELPPGMDPGPENAATLDQAASLTMDRMPGLNSTIEAVRFLAAPVRLKVVGVSKSELFGGRPQAYLTIKGVANILAAGDRVSQVDIVLDKGVDPAAFVAAHEREIVTWPHGKGLLLQTTEKVTSGFKKNLETNQIPLLVASAMAFLSAAFIIMTGMTVNITERKRELAILRCIGASRWHVAEAQIWMGLFIGVVGATIGVPVGLGLALAVLDHYKDTLKIEVFIPTTGLVVAQCGAVLAGLVGALWPAWQAARMSPLKALGARAERARPGRIVLLAGLGLAGVGIHAALGAASMELDTKITAYLWLGMPGLLIGYFLLSVPLMSVLTGVVGGAVSWVFAVPTRLLTRSVRGTPYRMGFTAGAMMTGLALMVAIRTQGRAILDQWLGAIQFPEMFVTGSNLKERHQKAIEALPFVTDTVPISLQAVETDAFKQGLFVADKTTFIGFDPEPFFKLANVQWVQGDQESGLAALKKGGSVIVAREFLTARGLGKGDRIKLGYEGRSQDFEIAGVITSPGLDLVNQFFDIGQSYVETAIHAVFGTREDLRDRLLGGVEPSIRLLQIGLAPESDKAHYVDDAQAEEQIRDVLEDAGILDVGNGRKLKSDLTMMISRSIAVTSVIAVMSMLVACMGVANLIIAGIDARQFEFGVLRAVGASRGLVLRLVLAEAAMVAIGAMVLGTLCGLQAVWAGQKLDAQILGIALHIDPPWAAIAIGWGIVAVLTLGAAAPAVLSLARRRPRELLAAVRG